MNKYIRFLTDHRFRFSILSAKGFYKYMSDEDYIKKGYRLAFGKELDLDNPQTFNEKLQWLKIHNRKPEYTTMVDKYEVKKYVADLIGEEYIIPTLGVWDRFDDIDFDKLPDQFVLKCTHNSGGLVICKDKSKLDMAAAKKRINKSLKRNYYWSNREWPYKNVKPRIIAEEYMVDESGYDLKDYKFFTFNGEVKMFFVERDRAKGHNGHTVDFFDIDFNHVPMTVDGYPYTKPPYYKPENFEKMIELATELSQGIPHVRVDFYNVNGKIYFGELTFFQASGMIHFSPESWDKTLGDWITLSEKD